jgi:saccharopine dehydrogenase-like NADP-dependent oxidoreductase
MIVKISVLEGEVMRVLALGGAGAMGVHACRTIVEAADDVEVVVADLDADRAGRVADQLGERAGGVGLDVTDGRALAAALEGADVVVNTVGPFFRFGVPVLRAAIAAGCDYVDICDDWEPTLDMLAMDGAAREAGVTALVGAGASPGVSNLLAASAVGELDEVDEVVTGWSLTAGGLDAPAARVPSAAVVHGIQQVTGTIRVTRDGRPVDEPPLRPTPIDYPGVGRRSAWTFGHPEALTLPAAFPSVRTSVNVAFADPATMTALRAIRWAVDRRLLTAHRAARIAERTDRWFTTPPEKAFRAGRLPLLFGLAVGRRDGRPAAVGCALAQVPGGLTMGHVTGIPLGVAALSLRGKAPGVHAPETLLGPAEFFAALAPHCLGDPPPEEMTVTTRSWEPDGAERLQRSMDRAREVVLGA